MYWNKHLAGPSNVPQRRIQRTVFMALGLLLTVTGTHVNGISESTVLQSQLEQYICIP